MYNVNWIYCYFYIFQTINEITNNNIKIFIVFIIIMVINGILHMNNLIPRVLSPLNYPSILDITPNVGNYIKCIILNIVLIIFNTMVGSIFIIKKIYYKFLGGTMVNSFLKLNLKELF